MAIAGLTFGRPCIITWKTPTLHNTHYITRITVLNRNDQELWECAAALERATRNHEVVLQLALQVTEEAYFHFGISRTHREILEAQLQAATDRMTASASHFRVSEEKNERIRRLEEEIGRLNDRRHRDATEINWLKERNCRLVEEIDETINFSFRQSDWIGDLIERNRQQAEEIHRLNGVIRRLHQLSSGTHDIEFLHI